MKKFKRVGSLLAALCLMGVTLLNGMCLPIAASDTTADGDAAVETEHVFIVSTEVAATCTEDGLIVYFCEDCGEKYIERTAATGHNFVETWTADGMVIIACEYCGATGGDAYVCNHNYEQSDFVDASCTDDGFYTYTCTECLESYNDIIYAYGHDYNVTKTENGLLLYECFRCGDYYYEGDSETNPDGCEHSYELWDTVHATCEDDGYDYYYCTGCGDSYTEPLAATGHLYVDIVTDDGNKALMCRYCGQTYEGEGSDDNTGSDACQHKFVETENANGAVTRYCVVCGYSYTVGDDVTLPDECEHYYSQRHYVEATCTEEGYVQYTCAYCGDISITYFEALGHNYVASKTEDGLTLYVCEYCFDSYTDGGGDVVVPPEDCTHKYAEYYYSDATCVDEGYIEYECVLCGDFYTEYFPALGHNYVDNVVDGVKVTICEYCGDIIGSEGGDVVVPPEEHIHDYFEVEYVEATCENDGYVVYICNECKDSYTDILYALGHDYREIITEAGNVYLECANCGETKGSDGGGDVVVPPVHNHEYYAASAVGATCENNGYVIYACYDCDETYTEILYAFGHEYSETKRVAATCTADGYIEYTCANCDDSYTLANGAATGHDFSKLIETVEPTYTTEGYNKYQCENCDETKTEILEKIPAPDFTLGLTGNTDHLHEGQIIEVTITPNNIQSAYGICSYDISELMFDSAVLKFTGKASNTVSQMNVAVVETSSGVLKVMVTDNSLNGIALKNGQGATTIQFEVLDGTKATTVAIVGSIGGTDAGEGLDAVFGNAENELSLAAGQSHRFTSTKVAPTCTEDGYYIYKCDGCDYSYTEPSGERATGHDFSNLIETVEPTHTAEGYHKYKCAHCDETMTEVLEKLKYQKGDVNGDGIINSTDFMQVRRHFLGIFVIPEEKQIAADVNGDGIINSTDFMQIRRHFLGTFVIK